VVAVSAIFLSVLAGAVLSTIGFLRAQEQRELAEQEAETAQQTANFLTTMLAAAQPENAKGEEVSVREILDIAAERLSADESISPQVESKLRRTVGESYLALARYDDAMQHLERSLELTKSVFGPDSPHVRGILSHIGSVNLRRGDPAAALETFKQLLALRQAIYGTQHFLYTETLANIALAYAELGRTSEAEQLLRECLEIERGLAVNREGLEALGFTLNNLATVLADQHKYDEATLLHTESLALREELYGRISPNTMVTLLNLGHVQVGQGLLAEAEASLRDAIDLGEKIFGKEHPRTASAYLQLAKVHIQQKRFQAGLDLAGEGIAILERTLGQDSVRFGLQKATVGQLYLLAGLKEEGLLMMEQAWDKFASMFMQDHPRVITIASKLLKYYEEVGDPQQVALWRSRSDSEEVVDL
jgi:tetratricopeptide (TPR) repeat protein